MIKCQACGGRGIKTECYSEVMEASGVFYDQDVVREIRTISVKCRSCKGSGKVEEKA